MPQTLGYATPKASQPAWPLPVFVLLLLVNIAGLAAGILMFWIGISRDSYAGFIAMICGVPLLFGQLILGVIPVSAFASVCKKHLGKWPFRILVLTCGAALTLDLTGLACAIALPATHGSTCRAVQMFS